MLTYRLIHQSIHIIAVSPPQVERDIYGNRTTNLESDSHTLRSTVFADNTAIIALTDSFFMFQVDVCVRLPSAPFTLMLQPRLLTNLGL